MELKQGYKITQVGLIPNDWTTIKLGDCLLKNPDYGINASAVVYNDSLPTYLRITDISENGKFISSNKASVNNTLSESYYLEKGDIVFARTGASVGKTYLYNQNDGRLVFAGFLIRIKPNPEIVDCRYLIYLTQTKTYWGWVLANSMRSGQPGLNSNEYKTFQIPLPPSLIEQTAIATALSHIDELISQTEKLIDKKKAIKQGVMQELLKFKEDWVTRKFTDIVDYIHGKAHEQFIVDDGKFKVVNSKFISSNGEVVKYSNNSFLTAKKNDILTVLSDLPNGKALAKCFLVDKDNLYAVNQRVCIWRTKGADSIFLYYLLNRHKYFLQLDDGVTQTHILNGDINRFELTITEDLETQKEIGVILSDLDKEIVILEKRNNKLKLQKQGMMQALLTGKIRLI